MEKLEIKGIYLSDTAGVATLNIDYEESLICLQWHEDWDCEAFDDTINVNPSTGGYTHQTSSENKSNFASALPPVTDRMA